MPKAGTLDFEVGKLYTPEDLAERGIIPTQKPVKGRYPPDTYRWERDNEIFVVHQREMGQLEILAFYNIDHDYLKKSTKF
jgi:hypothetical protein